MTRFVNNPSGFLLFNHLDCGVKWSDILVWRRGKLVLVTLSPELIFFGLILIYDWLKLDPHAMLKFLANV